MSSETPQTEPSTDRSTASPPASSTVDTNADHVLALELQLREEEEDLRLQAEEFHRRKSQIVEEEVKLRRQTEAFRSRKVELEGQLAVAKKRVRSTDLAEIGKNHAVVQAKFDTVLGKCYEKVPVWKVNQLLEGWITVLEKLSTGDTPVETKKVLQNPFSMEQGQIGQDKESHQEQGARARAKNEEEHAGDCEDSKKDGVNDDHDTDQHDYDFCEKEDRDESEGKGNEFECSQGHALGVQKVLEGIRARRIGLVETPLSIAELVAASSSWPWRKRSVDECRQWLMRVDQGGAKLSDSQEAALQIAASGEPRPDYTCTYCAGTPSQDPGGVFRWCIFRKVEIVTEDGKVGWEWDKRGCANCVLSGRNCEDSES
ncbi:hypothetical protein BJ508DRAFT_415538 [Ascobolus immersus RN42]|uniref:Uncharacterized protein n=1 Tax=Ascobolus immersus RN42 TaxID=1160509 RepID=A0A3N4I5R9_ASCIM|nr:hypothetical protein BJ508DRAFT_415538 [Ascobolus immersus RN42]